MVFNGHDAIPVYLSFGDVSVSPAHSQKHYPVVSPVEVGQCELQHGQHNQAETDPHEDVQKTDIARYLQRHNTDVTKLKTERISA